MPKLLSAAVFAGSAVLMAAVAHAESLPAPYVSRALDAVLIPIDGPVRSAFGLADGDKGVLVLAVAPGGVADQAGVAPGDVIEKAHGHAVTDPITLDEIVYYWINKGAFDFAFDGWRGGKAATYATTITLESYTTVIDVTTVSSWSSYSYESFSYEEYTSEYSSEMTETYESSESTIEETVSSDEFASEAALDEAMAEDAAGQEAMTEDIAADEAAADDPAPEDASPEDAAIDEAPAEDMAADDGTADDSSADDAGGDDGGDAGGDAGGDDGGGDVVEE